MRGLMSGHAACHERAPGLQDQTLRHRNVGPERTKRTNGKEPGQKETDMEQQTSVGGILGCVVCIVLAWGNPPLLVVLSAVVGLSFGSIVGFLIWIASIRLPDEVVADPFPGDERRSRRSAVGPVRTVRSGKQRRQGHPCPGHQRFAAPRGLRVSEPDTASIGKAAARNGYGWLSRHWLPIGETGFQPHLWRLLRVGLGAGDVGHGVSSSRPALRQRSSPARRKHAYR